MSSYSSHYSVLKKECLDFLTRDVDPLVPSLFADLTFGGGGHTQSLLALCENYFVTAVDQDPDALKNGYEIIKEKHLENRLKIFDTNFENFPKKLEEETQLFNQNFSSPFLFQGILLDLGVSSHHFDQKDRGFSFRFESSLDMRMNNRANEMMSAFEVVNTFSEEDLVQILSEYGEEKFSKRIAKSICDARNLEEIKTTKDLENIIFHCYPKKLRYSKLNPSTKSFQALRIFVNRELDVLSNVLPKLLPLLKMGGKIAVISFHSLEDRIVKNTFKEMELGSICCQVLTKKPIIPDEKEINENSRSRSAKLRVIERVVEKKSKNKYAHFSR